MSFVCSVSDGEAYVIGGKEWAISPLPAQAGRQVCPESIQASGRISAVPLY